MRRPVHVLEQEADVLNIVNMAAVAVIDAQERQNLPATRGA
jgi:phosphotransacetylase